MEYKLYTFGGGEILWKVFNAMALLFESNNPYLTSVMPLSIMLGLIWGISRAYLGNAMGMFNRSWLVPMFIIMNVAFLPKTTVHIIDRIDVHFHYAKVDNIPLALAAIPSLISSISNHIVTSLEEVLAPVDSQAYTKAGAMFGARLLEASRTARIIDPIMRQNVKNFTNRCFLWPYIYTNIKGLKADAKNTDNILGFIAENPHPNLGTYWTDPQGVSAFKTCAECINLVKGVMSVEVPKTLTSLATQLFNWDAEQDPQGQAVTARLKANFDGAWDHLAHITKSKHDIIQQELMINAVREDLDDRRSSHGLARLKPSLVGMESARAMEQQNMMELIRADTAGAWIPTIQTILMALLVIMFALVVPMIALPGGLSIFSTWCKLVMWVQLWPVFFTILHFLGLMFLAKSSATVLLNGGEGLNFQTQDGLANMAHNASSWVQGLQMSVPFLSWAFLSGSGYAMTSLASSMSTTLDSVASKAAAEVVEGNMSYDNLSAHGISFANQSVGQANLGGSFSVGESFNTGTTSSVYDPTTGKKIHHKEHSDVGFKLDASRSVAGSLSQDHHRALEIQNRASVNFEKAEDRTTQKRLEALDSIISGQTVHKGSSSEEQHSHVAAAKEEKAKILSASHTKAGSTGTTVTLGGGVGVPFVAKITADGTASASEHADKAKNQSTHNATSNDSSVVVQAAMSNQLVNANGSESNISKSLAEAYGESTRLGETFEAAKTNTESISQALSFVENNAASVNENLNDKALKYVADKYYNGSTDQAVQAYDDHPETFQPYLKEFLDHRMDDIKKEYSKNPEVIHSGLMNDEDQLNSAHTSQTQAIKGMMTDLPESSLGEEFGDRKNNHNKVVQDSQKEIQKTSSDIDAKNKALTDNAKQDPELEEKVNKMTGKSVGGLAATLGENALEGVKNAETARQQMAKNNLGASFPQGERVYVASSTSVELPLPIDGASPLPVFGTGVPSTTQGGVVLNDHNQTPTVQGQNPTPFIQAGNPSDGAHPIVPPQGVGASNNGSGPIALNPTSHDSKPTHTQVFGTPFPSPKPEGFVLNDRNPTPTDQGQKPTSFIHAGNPNDGPHPIVPPQGVGTSNNGSGHIASNPISSMPPTTVIKEIPVHSVDALDALATDAPLSDRIASTEQRDASRRLDDMTDALKKLTQPPKEENRA